MYSCHTIQALRVKASILLYTLLSFKAFPSGKKEHDSPSLDWASYCELQTHLVVHWWWLLFGSDARSSPSQAQALATAKQLLALESAFFKGLLAFPWFSNTVGSSNASLRLIELVVGGHAVGASASSASSGVVRRVERPHTFWFPFGAAYPTLWFFL
mmetsp:Transcript_10068/g.24024  ORF Transcript_10068/g.24024 Transcript_10068/m.24024 type:complete len:157 (-) Transcript_10068:222-692(-)